MKKNKLLCLIAVVLLVNALLLTGIFKDHKTATSELKPEMNFVSGTEGVAAEELKAAAASNADNDDFISMAVDRKINATKNKTQKDLIEKTLNKDVSGESVGNFVDERKADVVAEGEDETIPFDISHPEEFESGDVEYADNQILVKFNKSFDGNVNSDLRNAGIGKLEPMFETESGNWFVAYLHKRADVNNTMESVREMNNVVVAEYNFRSEAASIDTDPLSDAVTANEMAGQQWVLKSCGIQASWDYLEDQGVNPGGSDSVTVAVIDTGVDYNHKDLAKNIWVNNAEIPDNGLDDDDNGYTDDYYGIDMTAKYGSGMDDHGHGTHVAGIIAAENNNIGVVGIAYNTKIMPVKAGDASGFFLQSNVAEAIIYSYSQGADVINMSFGGNASSIAVRDALETAYSRCVLVAAAGNNGFPNEETDHYKEKDGMVERSYPGDYKFVLGVMSSDKNDVESGFSNWDAKRLNSNEYEVYAPGFDVLSTIPGDRYTSLSGTSMASPVVAAQAALLRSVFVDPDMYPTKFIYGQISGTADETVKCCNPDMHTVRGFIHNVPGRVNFENSLKTMPKPEVSVSDYTIFDTKGFSSDKEGIAAEAAAVNNGDGIIDSGEVIALGFTLRNRWGMSKDTVISLNATNEYGVTNPYVTILNNDINYGSVGTYSEQDSGKIMEGDMWTGWESPFYLKIADNCPNDSSIIITATVHSKNGLDETDSEDYIASSGVLLVVRNGVVLPNKISEDMTLTANNYYIIPNSTVIMDGATVTVEPGTKIQFWTNDPQDSYADEAIAYLKVLGKFICSGTEEAPVEVFPSDWLGQYRVEIYTADNGFVSLDYTNVANPGLTITRASNCVFTQNFANKPLYFKGLYEGSVNSYTGPAFTNISDASQCVFYALGGGTQYDRAQISGSQYNTCSFIDSSLSFSQDTAFVNCIFYGNNNGADESEEYGTSSYTINNYGGGGGPLSLNNLAYNPDWDKYYATVSPGEWEWNGYEVMDLFARHMDGSLFNIDTEEEFGFVNDSITQKENATAGTRKGKNGEIVNYNGTEIPSSIATVSGGNAFGVMGEGAIHFDYGSSYDYLLEIPGKGLATDIALDKYVVNLENGGTHKIEATLKPSFATQSDLVFTSENEAVATVDKNGVITGVAPGTTQIRAYAKDYAIYNYVTVNVTEHIALQSLGVAEDEVQMTLGDTKRIRPVFTPADTTRTAVTYTSSDESVASVSSKGIITANAVGDAIITLTGDNNLTATVAVHVIIPVQSIAFRKDAYETSMYAGEDSTGNDDAVVTDPEILPEDATNQNLIWESTDPEICTVSDGRLVKNSTGIVTLRATVEDTELYDEITVIISDNEVNPVAVKNVKYYSDVYTYAITEAGEMYVWGSDIVRPLKLPFENVEDAYMHYPGTEYILDKNGNVNQYYWDGNQFVRDENFGTLRNIKSLSSSNGTYYSFHAIDNNGSVWAWGANGYGILGDGSTTSRPSPVQLDFDNEIVKVLTLESAAVYLDDKGNVYVSGTQKLYKTPVLVRSGVKDIYSSGINTAYYCDLGTEVAAYETYTNSVSGPYTKEHSNEKTVTYNGVYYYIEDGQLYIKGSNTEGQLGIGTFDDFVFEFTKTGITDAKDYIVNVRNSAYIITNDGRLFGTGHNTMGELGIGRAGNIATPEPVEFFSRDYSEEPLTLTDWSGSTGTVESDGTIEVLFNMAAQRYEDFSLITLKKDGDEASLSTSKNLHLNKLTIKPKTELEEGASYTLTIPKTALTTSLNGLMSEDLVLTFEYHKSQNGETTDPGDEGEVTTEDPDDTEEIHDLVVDDEKMAQRELLDGDYLRDAWEEFTGLNVNARFYSNVILNRVNDDDTSGWLRITAPNSDSITTIKLGHNYWGTTNEKLINKQILDFDDYQSLADIDESGYLTEAPSNTFPFVTEAYLTVNGEKVDTVGNEEVTFVVNFNRPMDTSINLDVRFGSSYPYAEYIVAGEYVSDTEWQGTVKLNTLIENGYQYFSVTNGKAAGTSLKLYKDWGRFPFMIDTVTAQSLLMQASATAEGIALTWEQDDFDTLAGYNVYRSTVEDGLYTKINRTVIPADTKEFFDDTVEPGVRYYYNFTVVQSDMTESEPSGKVQATAFDTMAPNIYHSPVTTAYKGSNLVISATIIDNVGIENATLYYRVVGTSEWKSRTMDSNNDKYSAVINSSFITDDGLEYYIEAFDGNEYTYRGSEDDPFFVIVQEAFSMSDLGDVDGNGLVELKDALMLLMAVNDRLNLTEEEFMRADLDGNGELSAMEALKIINYINGTISSLR